MSWGDELDLVEDAPDRTKLLPGTPEEPVPLDEAMPGILDVDMRLWNTQKDLIETVDADGYSDCPCCGQRVGLHKRTIYRRVAKWLVWLVDTYKSDPGWKQWNASGSPLQNGGDVAKLALWGLVESFKDNSGLWRPTLLGISFAQGAHRVPTYCIVYNRRVLSWSTSEIDIQDALQVAFNLDTTLNRAAQLTTGDVS